MLLKVHVLIIVQLHQSIRSLGGGMGGMGGMPGMGGLGGMPGMGGLGGAGGPDFAKVRSSSSFASSC